MADDRKRPLLNPVLRLKMEPRPETQPGGGKSRESIVAERLPGQQKALSAAARQIYRDRGVLPTYAGRAHLLVRMFSEDSLAPSHTPGDLFGRVNGCQLVAPFKFGYVVEADLSSIPRLVAAIEAPPSIAVMSDISRVQQLTPFGSSERLRQRSEHEMWDRAPEDKNGRSFILWMAPFQHRDSQEALLDRIADLANQRTLLPVSEGMAGEDDETAITIARRQTSIGRAMRQYRNRGTARATVIVPTFQAFHELVASGVSHRIDPVRPIGVAAPGQGAEPPPPVNVGPAPIVAVVDGGLHAASYSQAEAWRATPFVSDNLADRRHGNGISSLAVQGHAWNTNRVLPTLHCRVGTVQAVPRSSANQRFSDRELIEYLAAVVRDHPDTHVWNISANQDVGSLDPDDVSVLGHELAELARAANILPVVSIGNVTSTSQTRLSPPADCEAAIVVGGRRANKNGMPAEACPACLGGPGPDGMLKPDVSWFSELRMIGGVVATGSSYPTPLVSSLAAHAFANLREPNPDLVKALLVNNCERREHDPKLGWGTPYSGSMPWTCPAGSVTLAWRAQLEPGFSYYWNDIPIPPELIHDGRLRGRVSLTAVLRPLISPFGGANYFASRLQTSIQYEDGDWKSLAGSMLESTLKESDARVELKKWQPVRRHTRDFSKQGVQYTGDRLRLYARVFTRDLYQFGWTNNQQSGLHDVSFVLTLSDPQGRSSVYDSMVQALGNFVESAVLDQEIEVDNE